MLYNGLRMTMRRERFYIRRMGNIISSPKKLNNAKSDYVCFPITLRQFNHRYSRATNTKRKAPHSAHVQIQLIVSNFTCFYCILRSSASTLTADSLNMFRNTSRSRSRSHLSAFPLNDISRLSVVSAGRHVN